MNLQGAQEKSLCAAFTTDRQREKETETADTDKGREVVFTFCIMYCKCTTKKCSYVSDNNIVLIYLWLADLSSTPSSHIPSWSSSWKAAIYNRGEGGLSRYWPQPWCSTICHTQQDLMATGREGSYFLKIQSDVTFSLWSQSCAPLHDSKDLWVSNNTRD